MNKSTSAYEFALEKITLPPTPLVLDLGSGQGTGTAYLSRALSGANIIGLDATYDCLNWETLATGAGHVSFVQGDAREMPLAGERFDALFAVMTFHCLPEPERVFQEMARLLLPGGVLVIADVDGHHWMARPFEWVEHLAISPITRAYTEEAFHQLAIKAGLTHISVYSRPNRKSFMMWFVAYKETDRAT